MNNKSWKVYKIESPNGRVYVGCTNLPLNQRFQGGRGYFHNEEMKNDIIQYGWANFKSSVIGEFESEELARRREHKEIQRYENSYNKYRGASKSSNPNFTPDRKPVLCVETGIIYPSIYQAAVMTGLSKQKISYCCRGVRYKTTGGYHWKFV